MLDSVTGQKFQDPHTTVSGDKRATVTLEQLKTLWFNTGTQCNLSCENCYIESSPKNDRLAFIGKEDVAPYLDEIKEQGLGTELIGLTGGEPFLNPAIIDILEEIMERGFNCLVLTNAHLAILRCKKRLLELKEKFGNQLQIRVSLDHFDVIEHERQRGKNTFASTLKMMKWLSDEGFNLSVAGRSLGDVETLEFATKGYQKLFDKNEIRINASDTSRFVLFPEMKSEKEVPEISVKCWDILGKRPQDQMCATERMIVKRKGEKPSVLACTLLAYDTQFELGSTLKVSQKTVPLNHRFCAEFCVLGGASCSSTAQ